MERLENILDIGGRSLSPGDQRFVTTLINELDQFQFQAPKDRALMFHPLSGYQRYLIHKVTELFPKLSSFSIGEDKSRRTVVCFKTVKKDRQHDIQGIPPAKSTPTPKNEYVNAPDTRDEDASRRATPMSRSRESSRSRKKQDVVDAAASKASPRNGKPETISRMPKPLRQKKSATKREMMKRSRSLQSSPVHVEDPDTYLTDEGGRRGRRRNHPDKHPGRSSSLKAASKRRERHDSPKVSENNVSSARKANIRHNASDVSLARRGHGIRLEGRVTNGDVEDPYSCGDSESDAIRIDAEAIRRERLRHKYRNAPAASKQHSSSNESSSDVVTEESDFAPDPARSHDSHREEESISESDDNDSVPCADEGDWSEGMEYDSDATDERPPSYSSLKRATSLKKAERNLERIKRGEARQLTKKPPQDETMLRDKSSKRSSSTTRKPNKDVAQPKRASTMPKSMKTRSNKQMASRASQTMSGRRSPHDKTHIAKPDEKLVSAKEVKQRNSTSSTKSRKKPRTSQSKPVNAVEADGRENARLSHDSLDGLISASNPDLYVPLPVKHKREVKPSKPKHSSKSAQSSPKKIFSDAATTPLLHRDGEAQTDVTGTLSRRPKPKQATASQPDVATKATPDLLATMMQSLGLQQNSPSYPQPPSNPNLLHAFQQFMQNNPLVTQSSYPPLPPHLMNQLYMSWIGAYVAGATGTWPPSINPSFMVPPSNLSSNNPIPPHDVPNFLNPGTLPQFPRYPVPPNQKAPEHQENQYYNPYYPPTSQGGEYPEEGSDPHQRDINLLFSSPPADDTPSSHQAYTNPVYGDSFPTSHHPPLDTHDNYPATSQINGRCNSSSALTDTDASSVLSSSKKGEVAIAANPKGGVMIYVRSQPNSRTSSTAGVHESMDSDNAPSLPTTSERGSVPNLSDVKKSPRVSRDSRKRPPSSSSKPGSSRGKKSPGESVPDVNLLTEHSTSTNHNHNHTTPLHESSKKKPASDAASKSLTRLQKSNPSINTEGYESEGSLNSSTMFKEAVPDVSQEEMILSLRRAPLATIEDDADDFFSESHASSTSSLNVSHIDRVTHRPSKESQPLMEDESAHGEAPSVPPTVSTEHLEEVDKADDEDIDFPPPPAEIDEDSAPAASSSVSSSSNDPPVDGEAESIDVSNDASHVSSSSLSSSENEAVPSVDETSFPPHDGSSETDSQSEGNYNVSETNSDPDQTKADEQASLPRNNVTKQVDGDVIVHSPPIDYYKLQANEGRWMDEKYDRFVELYNLPPKLSDIDLAHYLVKYRNLRLSRVDKTLALCVLPSPDDARSLLNERFTTFSSRPLHEATDKTKKKAQSKLESEEFEAARAGRPKTDPTVAKRLIAASLGNSKVVVCSGSKSHAAKK